MRKEKFDFGGWATKNDLLCADGRTIRKNAFKDDDGRTVPLVYQHNHEDPTRVIGHALLENRDEGVYAYGSLNNTDIAQHVKELIRHGDINGLSIFANKLTQRGGDVIHGTIRELSVVLAGANPGAVIEFPILEHGEESETEAYIWPGDEDGLNLMEGMSLEHSEEETVDPEDPASEETAEAPEQEASKEEVKETEESKEEETTTEPEEEPESTDEISHADKSDDETVQDVLNTLNDDQKEVVDKAIDMILSGENKKLPEKDAEVIKTLNEKQQKVVEYLLEQALIVAESNDGESNKTEEANSASHSDEEGEELIMANVFDTTNTEVIKHDALTADQMKVIAEDAKKLGSLRESVLAHSAEYGIDNIDYLMPEYREFSGNGAPAFIKRDMTWVGKVMAGVHHTPFSKVKTTFADITADQARARGYTKGDRKIPEVFTLLKRETGPKTIYKLQKMDRDDAIDLSNGFDMVAWLKSEMRMMLDEELARAFIIGDGREGDSDYKIDEDKIRPVLRDDSLFVVRKTLEIGEGQPRGEAIIDNVIIASEDYQGSGNCVAFMTRKEYSQLKLLKDKMGRRVYKNDSEIASALEVREIIFLPQMGDQTTVREDSTSHKTFKPVVIILDLDDYNVGADKGGSVNMFDDFDIDFNQQKYLIETRCSGALVKPFSAIVIEEEVTSNSGNNEDPGTT